MISVLRGGEWIPFITQHHLEEIACYENESAFFRRLEFISQFPFISYLRPQHEGANVGGMVDVQDHEIAFVADNSGVSHEDVLKAVRPAIRNGYGSGVQFYRENSEWWKYFRVHFAEESRRQKSSIANLSHFKSPYAERRIWPENLQARPITEHGATQHYEKQARWLEDQIHRHGDCRYIDPKAAADALMRETLNETLSDINEPNSYEAILLRCGIKRERLPAKATVEDACYEGIFLSQLGVYARRLKRDRDELTAKVRKEQIPSWVIWKELDSRTHQFPAEIGNVNDKHIATFGLYIDLVDVDKRTAELIQQSARKSPLCAKVLNRIPTNRGAKGLVEAMKRISKGAT